MCARVKIMWSKINKRCSTAAAAIATTLPRRGLKAKNSAKRQKHSDNEEHKEATRALSGS